MALKIKTNSGLVEVNDRVISIIVSTAVAKSFGVLGMASKSLKDGFNKVLRKNYSKGIFVTQKVNQLSIDVHIIAKYGVKLSEVSKSVQKQVEYNLNKNLGVQIKQINVIIDGVKA